MNQTNSPIFLEKSLSTWPGEEFRETVKQEIELLDMLLLPLQQGVSQGGYVADEPFKVMIIGVIEEKDSILVKAGVFYKSIIAGCNCADDPSPIDTNEEYCVVQFNINQTTGETSVALVSE